MTSDNDKNSSVEDLLKDVVGNKVHDKLMAENARLSEEIGKAHELTRDAYVVAQQYESRNQELQGEVGELESKLKKANADVFAISFIC